MRVNTIFAIFLVALTGSASNAMTCMEALRKANLELTTCRNIRSFCYDGWNEYGQHCYLFSHDKLNWFEAQAYCEALGARLPKVESEALNQWILEHIVAKGGNTYWLGSNDIKNEGSWRWAEDNSPVIYTNWFLQHHSPQQPDGASRENCLSAFLSSGGTWYDSNCYQRKNFACVN